MKIDMRTHIRTPQRWLVIALVALGLLMSACNGPTLTDASVAATVSGQTISLTQYQSLTRLLYELNRLQTPSTPTWQQATGRTELVTIQKQVLGLLVQNILLTKKLKVLDPTGLAQMKQQESDQLKQTFATLPAQYKPLIDAGILTSDSVRPLVDNQLLLQDIFQKMTVQTAHIRILTVKDTHTNNKQQAEDLRNMLVNGQDWSKLATQHSIDPAASAGGDIPVLIPGVFPREIDQQVFDPKTVGTDPFLVQSRLGWSIVQVVTRTPNVPISQLDAQKALFPGGAQNVQGSAIAGIISYLAAADKPNTRVNWCSAISGKDCGPVIAPDQMPA